MTYDYRENMIEDINQYFEDNCTEYGFDSAKELAWELQDNESLLEDVREALWTEDSVTGNASGSYTCNAYEAEENLCHNLDLLVEALEDFGGSETEALSKGAEYCDVTIRCWLLDECLQQAIDEA